MFAFIVLYPVIQAGCLYRNRHRLEKKPFAEQFKSAYEGLKISEGNYWNYTVLFFLRRLMVATCVIYFKSSVMTQFLTVTVTGLATIMLLAIKQPFASKTRNTVEILEELAILFINYHVFCFTDFVASAEV